MKKILLIIAIIVILPIACFNAYKFKLSMDSKKHLMEQYPNHNFIIGNSTYDFLNSSFVTKATCSDMGVDFVLRHGGKNIGDNLIKNMNEKKCRDFINKTIKEEEWAVYVQHIIGTPVNYDIMENENIDFKELSYSIDIAYDSNAIHNEEHFSEISYKIINALKQKRIKFNEIHFEENESDVIRYILHLENEDILLNKDGILKQIRKRNKNEDIPTTEMPEE